MSSESGFIVLGMTMQAPPRFGIWMPVYGNCGAMDHPLEPRDASYARARRLIQLAEECGFTTTLIAQHLTLAPGSVAQMTQIMSTKSASSASSADDCRTLH